MRGTCSMLCMAVAVCMLMPGTLLPGAPAVAGGPDAGRADGSPPIFTQAVMAPFSLSPARGGDVLRPDRGKPQKKSGPSAPSVWYLGFDAGITWSTFINGPMSFYEPNPYFPVSAAYNYLDYALPATVNKGSGIGFVVGGTFDYAFTDGFGLQLKAAYNQRKGVFDETTDTKAVHPDTQTGLTTVMHDKVNWTFNYFNVDLLARIQLAPESFYVLVGPTLGFLAGNSAVLDQEIVQPVDIYYQEANYVNTPTERMLRKASSTHEVGGLESTRVDLKAGIGTWIPISKDLFLTPELTVSYPLTKLVKSDYAGGAYGYLHDEPAAITRRYDQFGDPLVPNNASFNMVTVMFTLGLRWQMH